MLALLKTKKTLIHLLVGVFHEILIPGPIAYYVHTVRPWFNRAITCYAKAPVFPGFFPFRPKDGCSSIIEFVNNILFDIRSLVGLPQTGNTEAMISHVQIYSDKLSKIIG